LRSIDGWHGRLRIALPVWDLRSQFEQISGAASAASANSIHHVVVVVPKQQIDARGSFCTRVMMFRLLLLMLL